MKIIYHDATDPYCGEFRALFRQSGTYKKGSGIIKYLSVENFISLHLYLYIEARSLTALMPLSCWLNCITIPMIRGARNVGEHISSIMEILLSDCCA